MSLYALQKLIRDVNRRPQCREAYFQSPAQFADGYSFTATDFVTTLTVAAGGAITVTTQNTGATNDPVLTLSPTENASKIVTWACTSTKDKASHVPATCR